MNSFKTQRYKLEIVENSFLSEARENGASLNNKYTL